MDVTCDIFFQTFKKCQIAIGCEPGKNHGEIFTPPWPRYSIVNGGYEPAYNIL